MKVKNYKEYRYFEYPEYVDGNFNIIDKPKKVLFEVGDIVLIKTTKSLGVVIGCVDHEHNELRTDMDGMQCFEDLKKFKKRDLNIKGLKICSLLKKELNI